MDRRTPACVPEVLIARARKGDQRSFDAIFAAYQPGLLRYLRSVSPHRADDIAASTWESAARSFRRFKGDGDDFRRWLFTIARRRMVDEIRRESRRPLTVAPVDEAIDAEPFTDLVVEESGGWAGEVLARIPSRQAEVVALRVLGGLAVDEVAELLGITAANVRVLSHRGLQAIQLLVEPAASEGLSDEAIAEKLSSVV